MIIVWILLYWIVGIVIGTVCCTIAEDDDYEFVILCAFTWPMVLIVLICMGLYTIVHDFIEKVVKWFMK